MKKVLKGKVYCTETAKEVARIENGCIFYHSVKILFPKKTGEYFLYEKNVVDESIEPYTKEEADAWLKRHKAEIEETKKNVTRSNCRYGSCQNRLILEPECDLQKLFWGKL